MLCSPWDSVSSLTIDGLKQVCSPADFDIHELLGKGAYGTVHRMVHSRTNTTMAVKVDLQQILLTDMYI